MGNNPLKISTVETPYLIYLWQFMRHASPSVSIAQRACVARWQHLHATILESLETADHYPWTALARLEPPKFFSDIVESLIGAIYIDTKGSITACQAFLEHIGLMSYLRRLMQDNVALLHPKQKLGQLADQERVQYILEKEEKEEEEGRLTCMYNPTHFLYTQLRNWTVRCVLGVEFYIASFAHRFYLAPKFCCEREVLNPNLFRHRNCWGEANLCGTKRARNHGSADKGSG